MSMEKPRLGAAKRKIVGLTLALVMAIGLTFTVQEPARADTRGYAYISLDYLRRPSFNFGIPAWVTSNKGSKAAAKGACAAYVGHTLGLRWWLWFAPEIVCGIAIDSVWKTNQSTGICGSVPLWNYWGTRVWRC